LFAGYQKPAKLEKIFLVFGMRLDLKKTLYNSTTVQQCKWERHHLIELFSTDPNRIGLLGKPPAVKQFLSYKSQ